MRTIKQRLMEHLQHDGAMNASKTDELYQEAYGMNLDELLRQLEESGSSAALAVAEHIRTFAANGAEYATQESLLVEVRELRNWVDAVITKLVRYHP